MKKIIYLLIAVLVFVFPLSVFAESEGPGLYVETEFSELEGSLSVDKNDLSVDKIVEYVQSHLEEISVIITLLLSIFYNVRKHSKLNRSITTLNNNSVAVAENSASSMTNMADVVTGYTSEMAAMLAEVRRNNEERAQLEESLNEVSKYLKSTRLANVELANEVAELLILANIPNSKKDELYARHLAAVNEISEAERVAADETGAYNDEDRVESEA